jgi:hypothetical protein
MVTPFPGPQAKKNGNIEDHEGLDVAASPNAP